MSWQKKKHPLSCANLLRKSPFPKHLEHENDARACIIITILDISIAVKYTYSSTCVRKTMKWNPKNCIDGSMPTEGIFMIGTGPGKNLSLGATAPGSYGEQLYSLPICHII